MKSIEELAVECTDFSNYAFLEAKTAISVLLERWEAEIREDERLKIEKSGNVREESEKTVSEICPACLEVWPIGPDYCQYCGNSDRGNVREESEIPASETCPACQGHWPNNFQSCPICGNEIPF